MENNEDIFVTKPYLPSLDRLLPGLNKIWESKKVTNQALYHKKFEEKLSNYLGEPYVSLFSNCTIALMVAIRALELKGDIITSPFSLAATVHSLTWNNINPIFVSNRVKSPNLKTVENNKNKGNINAAGGAILFVIVQKNILSDPGNLNLDRA